MVDEERVTGGHDASPLVHVECVHTVRVQSWNEKVLAVNDHMVSTDRTDAVWDMMLPSVIDGGCHVSYHDDLVCTTCTGVCNTIGDDKRSGA